MGSIRIERLQTEIIAEDLERYYSEKSVINRYRLIRLSESKMVVKKTLITTRCKGTFVNDTKPLNSRKNIFINFLIKKNRVK